MSDIPSLRAAVEQEAVRQQRASSRIGATIDEIPKVVNRARTTAARVAQNAGSLGELASGIRRGSSDTLENVIGYNIRARGFMQEGVANLQEIGAGSARPEPQAAIEQLTGGSENLQNCSEALGAQLDELAACAAGLKGISERINEIAVAIGAALPMAEEALSQVAGAVESMRTWAASM